MSRALICIKFIWILSLMPQILDITIHSRDITNTFQGEVCNKTNPIIWYSKRQSIVAFSSTKAEYIALSKAAQEYSRSKLF